MLNRATQSLMEPILTLHHTLQGRPLSVKMMMQVLNDGRYMDVDTHWEIARVAKLILDKGDFRAKNTPGDNTPFIISSIYKPNNTTSTVSPNKWMEQEDKECVI